MKRYIALVFGLLWCIPVSVSAFGATIVEGNTVVTESSNIYNINPYNPASITGVGEKGDLWFGTASQQYHLSLSHPLYRFNEVYADTVTKQDGQWGVLRWVGVRTFTGQEDWQQVYTTSWQNGNTTLYRLDWEETIPCAGGYATHFDVVTHEEQKTRPYDGISICPGGDAIYLRVMRVKNMNTPQALNEWLAGRLAAGVPVQFFYRLAEPVFEPFSPEESEALEQADFSHVAVFDQAYDEGSSLLAGDNTVTASWPPDWQGFAQAVTEVRVEGTSRGWYFSALKQDQREWIIEAKNEDGDVFTGSIDRYENDFISSRHTSLLLTNPNSDDVLMLKLDLSRFVFPEETVIGSKEETGLPQEAYAPVSLVLPDHLLAVSQAPKIYGANVVTGLGLQTGTLTVDGQEQESALDLTKSRDQELTLGVAEMAKEKKTVRVTAPNEVPEEMTVMLLGDSLVGEGYYSQYLADCFSREGKIVHFLGVGTAGDTHHEGRGGWSAHDYCYEESKYGYTNIFLQDGRFNFSAYMKRQGYTDLDAVVIQLGINDLNLMQDNTPPEIIKNLNTIVRQIHRYDPEIEIYLNTPLLPFGEEETLSARADRLTLAQAMIETYSDRQQEHIHLIPIHAYVDPYLDYKLEEPALDADHLNQQLVVTDETHPAQSGYQKIAEVTYAYLGEGENK